jgi:hypothetical protein
MKGKKMIFLLQHNADLSSRIIAGYVSAKNLDDAVKKTNLVRLGLDGTGGIWLCDPKGRNWHLFKIEEATFPLQV